MPVPLQPLGPCRCEPGFLGRACDLHLWENQGAGWWHNVSAGDPAFSARIGAAGAFLSPPGLLAVFGGEPMGCASGVGWPGSLWPGVEPVCPSTGQDLNSALGDLVLYNFSANTWERWDLSPAPVRPPAPLGGTCPLWQTQPGPPRSDPHHPICPHPCRLIRAHLLQMLLFCL